ncbi:MAG: type I 3-dehydroquinate dehydratase [Acidobacteriota bacterium]
MIIVTVRESSVADARRAVSVLGPGAGGVEMRLDDLAGQDWGSVIAGCRWPVIATCRRRNEHGGFTGSETERRRLLRKALAAGAFKIDVEAGAFARSFLDEVPHRRLLVSVHEYRPGTTFLSGHADDLMALPRGVSVKLAYTPRRVSDCLAGRSLLARARREGREMTLVPMGEAGVPGRILALSWGSAWSYAAPDGAPPVAPGQSSLFELADLYRASGIGPDTVLTGLLGWPTAPSLSPWMHNRAARDAGRDARYLPFPEEDAADFLVNAAAWGLQGVSVTHPHKERVLPWLDELTDAARGCGAVNTLSFTGSRCLGDNTDAPASLAALEQVWPAGQGLAGKCMAIVGAGGAARAVAWAASRAGIRVTLYNRDPGRGEAAAAAVGAVRRPLEALAEAQADILVNATPVGMWPRVGECPVPEEAIRAKVIFDLVSNPVETCLLKCGRAVGALVQNGLAMLVRQGEAQYRAWHGSPPPPGAFQAAAWEGLRRREQL